MIVDLATRPVYEPNTKADRMSRTGANSLILSIHFSTILRAGLLKCKNNSQNNDYMGNHYLCINTA